VIMITGARIPGDYCKYCGNGIYARDSNGQRVYEPIYKLEGLEGLRWFHAGNLFVHCDSVRQYAATPEWA
jgi:hypothetical protein